MANVELRKIAKAKGVRQWQIADEMKISEATLNRKMRHEMTEEEKAVYLNAVDRVERGALNG